MKGHLYPAPNPIAERFRFNTRDRQPSESIYEYLATLRRLSEHCDYGATVEEMLRDRLVCGVKNEKVQQRLLSEKDLTLTKALQIAIAMESAAKYSLTIQQHQTMPAQHMGEESFVNKLDRRECYRCRGRNHVADVCQFKDKECFFFHNRGHTTRKCRQKERSDRTKEGGKKQQQRPPVRHLAANDTTEYPECSDEFDMLNLYKSGSEQMERIFVDVSVNNMVLKMEVNTGASMSVVSKSEFRELKLKSKQFDNLGPTSMRLRTFTGELIKPVGWQMLP